MAKTFLERKDPQGPYVFVSYSHADADTVGRFLTALNENGADFWYDIKLRGGQNWESVVHEVTQNKNCRGIIYLVSANFVYSSACLKELAMLAELKERHGSFGAYYIFMGEEDPKSFDPFIAQTTARLMGEHPKEVTKVLECINTVVASVNKSELYRTTSTEKIDDDAFIELVCREVFAAWGCASEENGKLDMLVADGLTDPDYHVRTSCRTCTELVRVRDIRWKVFGRTGNKLSAILVADELYDATCKSLALGVIDEASDNVNISQRADVDEERKKEKHLIFEPEFLDCLCRDDAGHILRYLRATEHEKHYLQLREALEKVPITNAADDGYFFVQDNAGNILYADRASSDVYRYIRMDAYAGVIPVIDIDYDLYRAYVVRRTRA